MIEVTACTVYTKGETEMIPPVIKPLQVFLLDTTSTTLRIASGYKSNQENREDVSNFDQNCSSCGVQRYKNARRTVLFFSQVNCSNAA